jgi:1-acyl-sn-glycerol-3-phosphate acyltransferase
MRSLLFLVSSAQLAGRENFPPPPFITIANHLSYWDALVAGSLIVGNLPVMTAKKYRDSLFGKMIGFLFAPIWVEQESADRHAIKQALQVLESGTPLAISPEGTRSKTGQLKEPLDGAAYLIHKADVPVVPVAITGTENIFRQLRPKVTGLVGKPFRLPEVKRPTKEQLKEDSDRLMCAIAALLPEKYHGVYRGHPLIQEMAALVR